MNCNDVRESLDRYAADTLSATARERIRAHLESCAACREEASSLMPLLSRAASLPRAIRPPEDLWPAISRKIAAAKMVAPPFGGASPRPWWAKTRLLAAAAVVLVVLSSTLTVVVMQRGTGTPAIVAASLPGDFLMMEVEYAQASGELVAALEQGRVKLAPETRAILERNLRVIDQALLESRAALGRDPANVALRDLVLSTYRHKLDLLRRTTTRTPAST